MTLIQVFDALNGRNFSYLETKDGVGYGGAPLKVNFCSDLDVELACLGVDEYGLTLHFKHARTEGSKWPLTNVSTDVLACAIITVPGAAGVFDPF